CSRGGSPECALAGGTSRRPGALAPGRDRGHRTAEEFATERRVRTWWQPSGGDQAPGGIEAKRRSLVLDPDRLQNGTERGRNGHWRHLERMFLARERHYRTPVLTVKGKFALASEKSPERRAPILCRAGA